MKPNEINILKIMINWKDGSEGWFTQNQIFDAKKNNRLTYKSSKSNLKFHYLDPLCQKKILESKKPIGSRNRPKIHPTHWRIRQNSSVYGKILKIMLENNVEELDKSNYAESIGWLKEQEKIELLELEIQDLLYKIDTLKKIQHSHKIILNKKFQKEVNK